MVLVYTIGHSTRTIEELLGLLRENDVQTVVDVRRFPGSRRHPQFGKDQLPAWLATAGIAYVHADALGGRRVPREDSPNDGWRNAQFRGYADYMDTDEFRAALHDLIERASKQRVAIMCAEAVPWRCHRQLIADALLANGVQVRHILQPGRTSEHELNPSARVLAGGRVVYPGTGTQMDLL
jgi:uncharacterized protein (DUF488 family)